MEPQLPILGLLEQHLDRKLSPSIDSFTIKRKHRKQFRGSLSDHIKLFVASNPRDKAICKFSAVVMEEKVDRGGMKRSIVI